MKALVRRQRGFALLIVMVLGTVSLYAATGIIGDGAATEREAQEKQLLKLRAYWAAQGHIVYALSRSRQGPPCGGECKDMAQRIKFFEGAEAELADHKDGAPDTSNKAKDRHWIYPEISTSYFMPIHFHIEDADGGSRLVLRSHFKSEKFLTHPFISENWPINGSYAAIICTGLSSFGSDCAGDEGEMDKGSSLSRISHIEPR